MTFRYYKLQLKKMRHFPKR